MYHGSALRNSWDAEIFPTHSHARPIPFFWFKRCLLPLLLLVLFRNYILCSVGRRSQVVDKDKEERVQSFDFDFEFEFEASRHRGGR